MHSHLCSSLPVGLYPEVAMFNMSLSLAVTSLLLLSCHCEPLLLSLNTPPYQHGSNVQAAPLTPASYCVLLPPIGRCDNNSVRCCDAETAQTFAAFSRHPCPKWLTVIHTFIHMLMVVAAMQGADQQHIRSSLGFSILPKDTLTHRPGGSNQMTISYSACVHTLAESPESWCGNLSPLPWLIFIIVVLWYPFSPVLCSCTLWASRAEWVQMYNVHCGTMNSCT